MFMAWEVWHGGRLRTLVFWELGMSADDVRRALIRHDGYPPDIDVREPIPVNAVRTAHSPGERRSDGVRGGRC